MKAWRNVKVLFLASSLALFACGTETNEETNEETTQSTTQSSSSGSTSDTTVSGSVTMAPVAEAFVRIFKLNEDGSRGDLLVTVSTDENGEYIAPISYSGAVEIVAVGGTYEDEATGETVTRGESEEIRTQLAEVSEGHVGINALTTIAAANASQNAEKGLATAISAANKKVSDMFGLSGVDFVSVKPNDLTKEGEEIDESSDESKLGLVMAGISQMAKDNGILPADLGEMVKGISEDYSDGSFDEKSSGEDLSVALSVTPDQAMKGLSLALENFAKGPRNQSGFSPDNLPQIPEQPTAPDAPSSNNE